MTGELEKTRPVLPPQPAINAGQLRKIWHSVRALGWSDGRLHEAVQEIAGKGSLRTLTREEGARVIDRLVAAGADPTQAPRPKHRRAAPLAENVVAMLTDAQAGMIARLCYHLGWTPEHPDFRVWLLERIGCDRVRTKREGQRVLNALRAKVRDAGIEDQVAESHRHPHAPAPQTRQGQPGGSADDAGPEAA